MLEEIVESYFKLYENGMITIEEIEFALGSLSEKNKDKVRSLLKKKGVPLEGKSSLESTSDNNNATNSSSASSSSDNEGGGLPGGGGDDHDWIPV